MSSPIIPWLGGKRRLAEKILPMFPQHECYVEAFCGGAALYFLRPCPAPVEVINDINGELVNLYRVVQHHAFGGKVSGQNFGTATTSPMINLCRIEENLSAAHLRLAGTNIENLAWLECLQRYDREHTFFYLDPPYWETEGYGVPFVFDEYVAMADFMRGCKGRVMVSINDHAQIREAFAGLSMLALEIKYSVGNNQAIPQTSGELVITNFESVSRVQRIPLGQSSLRFFGRCAAHVVTRLWRSARDQYASFHPRRCRDDK